MFRINRLSVRLIGGATIGVMLVGTSAAAHATVPRRKPIIRTVHLTYHGGCGISAGLVITPGSCVVGDSYRLTLRRGEKYVSVWVKDANLPKVPAILWLGAGVDAPNRQFCTSIKNFSANGTQPQLDLFEGVDPSCAPGSATNGRITVTFSSIRLR